jgi:NhaP-type Na+/H+ or K+/H+ antiporter
MDRARTIFLGALIGAATGVVAASLLSRRAEQDERAMTITSGEGLKLGILIFGLLRSIALLGEDKPA